MIIPRCNLEFLLNAFYGKDLKTSSLTFKVRSYKYGKTPYQGFSRKVIQINYGISDDGASE